jgi:hypothetical protein
MSPAAASPLKDATTTSLEAAGQSPKKSGLVLSFAVLFLAVIFAFAVGMILRGRMAPTPTQTPPVVTEPGTGLPPPPPGAPPAPGTSTPVNELMYPGAQIVMDMKNGRDNFLELNTSDPVNKVVDWYIARLRATEILRTPGAGAVLRAGSTQVIISPKGNGSDILIKQGVKN